MKSHQHINRVIFVLLLFSFLTPLSATGNVIQKSKEKLKKIFSSLQDKSNLAPVKIGEIHEGMLVVPDYETGLMQPMPNLNTTVNVEIEGMIASTTVDQMYTNDTDEILETIYIFPLPHNAAVRDMEMIIGDRRIQGMVEEKQQARKMYNEAKASGKKAGLTEQERPNIFTNSVANILPGDVIIIRLKLVEKLQYESGSFSYRFPLVVGPRFIPGNSITGYSGNGWAFDTDVVPDASRITPPVIPQGMRTGNDVKINVTLNAGLPIEKIESSSHSITTTPNRKDKHHIKLTEKRIIPNKDFVLEYQIKPGKEPTAALFTSTHEDEHYFMLLAMPPDQSQEIESVDKELIFILDVSGSMQGVKLRQAKAALIHALRKLTADESFNIIAFNNGTKMLNPDPITAHRANIYKAIDFVNSLNAGGGTMALPALDAGFSMYPTNDKVKMVIFITDGAVGNEYQLVDLIERKLGKSRFFTVAIGHAPNSFLLERISERGKGSFSYIDNQNQVEKQMNSLFAKIEHPVLTDLQFKIPMESEIYPGFLPDLFKGQPLSIVGKLEKGTDMTAEISGKTSNGHFSLELPLNVKKAKAAPGIPTVWARSKVKFLMNNHRRRDKSAKQQIIEIAKSFNLVTQFTSFIAIEDEISNPSLAYNTRVIPTEMPEGWNYESVFGSAQPKSRLGVSNSAFKKSPVGVPGQLNPLFKSLPGGSTPYPTIAFLGIVFIAISLFIRRYI